MRHPVWCITNLCTIHKPSGAHKGRLRDVVEYGVYAQVWVEQQADGLPYSAFRKVPEGRALSPDGAIRLGELLADADEFCAMVARQVASDAGA